ncbi:MAG: rod shape-determining protein MreC [Proteobacteria bacterium]|nr:rod shape-determining protein MreC [Pseudomonadota bacterium]
MHGRLKRTFYVLLIILLAFNLFYLVFSNRYKSGENISFLRFFIYPAYLINKTIIYIGEKKEKVLGLSKAYEDLQSVKRENEVLQAEILLMKRQIEDLEGQLKLEKLKENYPFSITVTKVVGRNPMLWHQFLIIDGGADLGFKAGMPVITKDGLVGKISEVYEKTSKIILLVDQDFACDVRGEKSDILALVSGTGTSVLKLNYVPKYEEFSPGETLITSGFDNSFPQGIPVGYIVEINKPFGSYFLEAFVIPYVDVLRLKEVMVVKDYKRSK